MTRLDYLGVREGGNRWATCAPTVLLIVPAGVGVGVGVGVRRRTGRCGCVGGRRKVKSQVMLPF